jgi:hypothetical protein
LIVTRPSVPAAFRKPDAVAVHDGLCMAERRVQDLTASGFGEAAWSGRQRPALWGAMDETELTGDEVNDLPGDERDAGWEADDEYERAR